MTDRAKTIAKVARFREAGLDYRAAISSDEALAILSDRAGMHSWGESGGRKKHMHLYTKNSRSRGVGHSAFQSRPAELRAMGKLQNYKE